MRLTMQADEMMTMAAELSIYLTAGLTSVTMADRSEDIVDDAAASEMHMRWHE